MESTSSATAEQEAAVLINSAIEGQIKKEGATDGEELKRAIEERTEHVTGETRGKVNKYIPEMLDATKNGNVEKLPDAIGGKVENGEKTIAASTLQIRGSLQETLAQMDETKRHEDYHKEKGHTEAIASAPDKEGDIAVTVGGEDFTNTEFIEGLTVDQTGDKFVSAEYKKHRQRFRSALSKSGLDVKQVETAIEKRNLGLIDDSARKPEFALAA